MEQLCWEEAPVRRSLTHIISWCNNIGLGRERKGEMSLFDRSEGLSKHAIVNLELDLIRSVLTIPEDFNFDKVPVLDRLNFICDLETERLKWGGSKSYDVTTKALVLLCTFQAQKLEEGKFRLAARESAKIPEMRNLTTLLESCLENIDLNLDSEEAVGSAGLVTLVLIEGFVKTQDKRYLDAALFCFERFEEEWSRHKRVSPSLVRWFCKLSRSLFVLEAVPSEKREQMRKLCVDMHEKLLNHDMYRDIQSHPHRMGTKTVARLLQALCDMIFMIKSSVVIRPGGKVVEDMSSVAVKMLVREYIDAAMACINFLLRAQNLDRVYFKPSGAPLVASSLRYGGFNPTLADPEQDTEANTEALKAMLGVMDIIQHRKPSPQPRLPFGGAH